MFKLLLTTIIIAQMFVISDVSFARKKLKGLEVVTLTGVVEKGRSHGFERYNLVINDGRDFEDNIELFSELTIDEANKNIVKCIENSLKKKTKVTITGTYIESVTMDDGAFYEPPHLDSITKCVPAKKK